MVSMQPTNQSYLPEEESCFRLPTTRPYRAGSVMSVLMKHSPIFAYLAQVSALDTRLDSDEFHGTVFAPCREYCDRYWSYFNSDTIDHQRAREMVLAAILPAQMLQNDLYLEPDVDVPFTGCETGAFPTLHRYSYLYADVEPHSQRLKINQTLSIVKGDLQCCNGIVHLLTGLIEPEASI